MVVTDKKIAFILYGYPLGVSTMLINTIAMFKECGNDVAIILDSGQQSDLPCETWLSELFVTLQPPEVSEVEPLKIQNAIQQLTKRIQPIHTIDGIVKTILHALSRRPVANTLIWENNNSGVCTFAALLKHYISNNKPDLVMAVECVSLIATVAAISQIKTKPKLIYFDMELLDWTLENPLYTDKLELKQLQFDALKHVNRVVITSFDRAKLFTKINKFPLENISVLPVVPRKRQILERSRYFRDKFNIGNDKILVVYAGNFMPWAQCVEMIESMSSWPSNAVLVMHTFNKYSLASVYYKKMVCAATSFPVYFSTEYLRYGELGLALSSADIGLLYYQAIDDNFTEICFSSNKMGEYLASGLPVICSPHESLKSFVDKHQIGFAVDFCDIGSAIMDISADRNKYYCQVRTCCNEYYVFDKYFNEATLE